MDRRAFLAGGTVGVALFAGCWALSDSDSETPTQPPEGDRTARTDTSTRTPSPATFRVSEITVAPNPVRQAHELAISISVRNNGGTNGRATLAVTLGSELIETLTIELAPDESTVITTNARPGVPGQRTVNVGAAGSSTHPVEPASTTVDVQQYPSSFVDTTGARFTIDGERFRYNGANCKKLAGAAREYIDDVLADAARMGIRVIRLRCHGEINCHHFGGESRCEEDYHVFQPSPGERSETTFRNIDYIIYRAKQHGIRLILHLTNNWGKPDYSGSMNWYVEHADIADRHDDFYTDETTRQMYKDYAEAVLSRTNTFTGVAYRDEPTIMLWELANEAKLENSQEDTTGRILGEWYREMAEFIAERDQNHLISTGAVGLYAPNPEGRAYIDHHEIDAIDACSTHIYPKEPTPDESLAEMTCWLGDNPTCESVITNRVQDAHNIVEKPVYIGEWGVGQFLWNDDPEKGRRVVRNVFEQFYDGFTATDVDGVMLHELFSDDYFTGYDWLSGGEVMAYEYNDRELRAEIESYSQQVNA